MASREIKEINAGSMADIAFLLLIFFLVTTTMDQDSGIVRQLPPIQEEEDIDKIIVIERNVFEVLVNKNDQLLVEEDYIQINELKDRAIEFMTNSGVFSEEESDENLTERRWIDVDQVHQQIALLRKSIEDNPDDKSLPGRLKSWEAKIDAINYFGKYRELNDAAVISLKSDNNTSYETYVEVQNELTAALNELRDGLTLKHFNKTYLELDKDDKKERKIIKAVRQIFPQRISEAEPNQ